MTLLRRTPASSESECAGCHQQERVGSETLHQQNPPVLNCENDVKVKYS